MQQSGTDTRIFDHAVRWIDTFKSGTGDRATFFAWLAESPRHVEELQFALALMEEISELTSQQRTQIETVADQEGGIAAQMTASVVPIRQHGRAETPRRTDSRWMLVSGLAAGVAVIALSTWLAIGSLGAQVYATRIGEQRSLQLEDGSTVHLNARSRLRVRFTAELRQLELIEGEALFKVASDASRPFRVAADESVIQAIGTQFNVHRRASGTVVSVLEGAVRVEQTQAAGAAPSTTLKAGEEVRIGKDGRRIQQVVASPGNVTAWRQHRLVFQGDTLADIATEFNRYNVSPQIRIEGEVAATRHFAGTFDTDAPQALIEALAADASLQITRTDREIVIRSR